MISGVNEFQYSTPVSVTLKLPAGGCEITAVEDGDLVRVLTEPSNAADDRDRRAAEDAEVSFEGGALRVRTPGLKGIGRVVGRRAASVRVAVTVPAGSSVHVEGDHLTVSVRGTVAALTVNNSSGAVSAEHVTGDVSVDSSDGDVRISRVDGSLRVDSAAGAVDVGATAGVVSVSSSSGSTRLGESHGDVKVSTASGDLVIDAAHQGSVRYNSSSGDLTVGVASGTDITTDFPSDEERFTVAPAVIAASDALRGSGRKAPSLSLKVSTASGRVAVTEAGRA